MSIYDKDPGTVVHLDDSVIVIDKPPGLPAVPGRGEDLLDSVSARVQHRWPDALVVHRLDMATSGLLLFARGADAQRRLSLEFAERRVDKRYIAIVHGLIDGDTGTIDLPLAADWPNRPRQVVDHQRGKQSTTHWWRLSFDPARRRTRLALTPVTGRSHQLRVHLQAIGHPIIGDTLYGHGAHDALEPRLLLHASHLGILHPASLVRMSFDSPPPF